MGTPRPQSPPLSLKPPIIPLPPPPPPLLSPSPPHDFSFSFSLSPPLPSSPPPFHVLLPLPVGRDMSRTPPPPLGRVGSDLSHNNYAKANHHHQTSTTHGSSQEWRSRREKDKERNKNKASPFFSGIGGLGGAWRSSGERSSRETAGNGKAEDNKPRKGNVGQRVRKYMACLVEQLLASFSRHGERQRREQRHRRRRPHSFSVPGNGTGGACCTRDQRERWRRQRRGGQLSSAPASLRASPVNSGHLSVGGGSVKVSTSSEESTMEELQSAIQAAIAHCKNSHRIAGQVADARGPPGLPCTTQASVL